MSNLSNARAQLEEWEAKKPEDYTSKYKDRIDGVMGQLDGMKEFDYDPDADTAYQQYKSQYTRSAKLANQNAQANAAMLAGGYGSSYADSVAKQGRGISVPIWGDRALIFNSIRTPFPKNMKTIRNILRKLYCKFTRRPGKTTRASCRPASSRRRPCTAAARRRTAPASPW